MFLNFYYFFALIALTLFTLYGEAYVPAKTYNLLSNLAIGAIGAIIGMAINSFRELRGKMWTCLVAQVRYHNTYIRVSVAYLFKIYVDGRYLLVKSRNVPGQFQPVGGVYKRLRDSVEKLNQLEVLDDKEIRICDTTRLDLRVRVKGKHLAAFIKWFESKEDREISHWREFCEELVQPKVLSSEVFPHVNYRFLHQNPYYLHYSEHYGCQEMLIHEVYELMPSPKQLEEIRQLIASPSSDIQWADESAIRKLGYAPDNAKPFSIGEHTNSLFNKEYRVK
jgi:hypothetical protein